MEKLCQKEFGKLFINSQTLNGNNKIPILDDELSYSNKKQNSYLNRHESTINKYKNENRLINSDYHIYQHRKSFKEKSMHFKVLFVTNL